MKGIFLLKFHLIWIWDLKMQEKASSVKECGVNSLVKVAKKISTAQPLARHPQKPKTGFRCRMDEDNSGQSTNQRNEWKSEIKAEFGREIIDPGGIIKQENSQIGPIVN